MLDRQFVLLPDPRSAVVCSSSELMTVAVDDKLGVRRNAVSMSVAPHSRNEFGSRYVLSSTVMVARGTHWAPRGQCHFRNPPLRRDLHQEDSVESLTHHHAMR